MSTPRRNPEVGGDPADRPARLPQRWVIILGLAGAAALVLSVKLDLAAGATAGVAVIGLLHAIMD